MIRECIHCKHIFGCQRLDGKKWKCNDCGEYGSCTTRIMLDPPVEDITGGICDWCFNHLVIPGRSKLPPHGVDVS